MFILIDYVLMGMECDPFAWMFSIASIVHNCLLGAGYRAMGKETIQFSRFLISLYNSMIGQEEV
jgi:hypothetical protein